jgi:hypothetical protein
VGLWALLGWCWLVLLLLCEAFLFLSRGMIFVVFFAFGLVLDIYQTMV